MVLATLPPNLCTHKSSKSSSVVNYFKDDAKVPSRKDAMCLCMVRVPLISLQGATRHSEGRMHMDLLKEMTMTTQAGWSEVASCRLD